VAELNFTFSHAIVSMPVITQIACPNCGNPTAERHNVVDRQLTRTQCHQCDYLLVTCQRTNRVVEAYAPSMEVSRMLKTVKKSDR
jgi:predicted RNA-binding Zn-ribbon protein involved in translation (DUF1610 family)